MVGLFDCTRRSNVTAINGQPKVDVYIIPSLRCQYSLSISALNHLSVEKTHCLGHCTSGYFLVSSLTMHFTKVSALVAAFTGLAIASPVEPRDKKQFSVKQVHVGKKVKPAPALAMLNTYHKFAKAGAKAPAPVKSAAAAAASGSVSANPEAYDEVCQ